MRTAIFICLFCLAARVPVLAQSREQAAGSLGDLKRDLKELRAEHRAHIRAHRLVAEMGLFDEFAVSGRTVILQTQEILPPDGILSSGEREELVGPIEQIVYAEPGVELAGGEFAGELAREIGQLQDTIRSLERSHCHRKRARCRFAH